MKKIIFLGATGGCADLIDLNNQINEKNDFVKYCPIGVLDDKINDKSVFDVPILGGFELAQSLKGNKDINFITAIGSANNFKKRASLIESLNIPKPQWSSLIHPDVSLSKYASIGVGVVIHAGVRIGANVKIGDYAVILPNSVIGHDTVIGAYSIINSGVNVSGDVIIEECCYIGNSAAIRDHITIGKNCLVGMGSIVVKNLKKDKIYFGSPAYEKN
jgi:sugar O-acyltransferase (sialic acid O-acetyltransferase NeuD family)